MAGYLGSPSEDWRRMQTAGSSLACQLEQEPGHDPPTTEEMFNLNGRRDTGAAEGGRRAGDGREDAGPQVVLDRA